ALAREPKLILADEPTGNLDEESGERVFECMQTIQRENGVTCIMVTHDADLADRVDTVTRLRDGRVVEGPVPPMSRTGMRACYHGAPAPAHGRIHQESAVSEIRWAKRVMGSR